MSDAARPGVPGIVPGGADAGLPTARPGGRVEVVCGPMFAGKTEELLRRVRRAEVAGRRVEVVGHVLDTRRGTGTVSSHSGLAIPSRTARDAHDLERIVRGAGPLDLVAVDEAHFFGPELVDVVQRLADDGLVVVVAGLDVTFDARPFEPLPTLAALAERVDKLTAVCAVCGEDAAFHVRVVREPEPDGGGAGDPLAPVAAHVGGAESYEARCRVHLPGAPWRRQDGGGAGPAGSSTSGTNE
ncbi:thymidine kinase [Cellulosimicrobium cellulans]|uniref:thymidine kinase n=1 Tax=Cellulosimicrobium cellulans TaxID=1710 RepID=UPI001BA568AC|nr:thymidine kinase [Cellulosimicrobium cellulans]QUC00281.1 thymidine kinase [Cellulosimicrobium cellulans]